jgi:hypothetical protein
MLVQSPSDSGLADPGRPIEPQHGQATFHLAILRN